MIRIIKFVQIRIILMRRGLLLAISLVLQFYKLTRLIKLLKMQKKMFSMLRGLDLLSIEELKSKIMNGAHKIGDLVLTQGFISSHEPLKSILDPNTNVAYSQLIMDKMLEIGTRTNTIRKSIRKVHPSFFKLSNESGESINIYETMCAKILPSSFKNKINVVKVRIFNFGWLLTLFLRHPTRTVSSIYTEAYIPNNSYNVVLGQVHRNSETSELFFKNPKSIATSKAALVSYIADQISFSTLAYYGLTLLIITTIFMFYKYQLEGKITSWVSRQASTIDKYTRIFVRTRVCQKCNNKLSNVINHPCGHLNICSECRENTEKCTTCHRRPKQIIQVYPC